MGLPIRDQVDIAIAGGGLSGALVAWRLRQRRPDLRVVMIEKDRVLGGNHTWSFHGTDVTPGTYEWLSEFVTYRWPRQQVIFPAHRRSFETPYCSITSSRMHELLAPALGDDLFLNQSVAGVAPNGIALGDGTFIAAQAVIDARGERRSGQIALGFQKFVGQELEFARPHGLDGPVIMDASVAQHGGYRFLYVLPFTERIALVEDTRYSDGAAFDREELRSGIAAYCKSRGWIIAEKLREEEGVLPIALAGDMEAYLAEAPDGVALAGMRAALFHPLTGYSLPDAAALADLIAGQADFSGPALAQLTRGHAASVWRRRSFYRLLSRMLFDAAEPDQRYKVLQRFYKMSQPLIERFYAGVSPVRDQARIFMGKPPVPVGRAMGCVSERQYLKRTMMVKE